ncbi:helix-turn-helix domain-containing protein [Paenibacillus sp. J2TS4]|uniref:helix-turn-helix domain-containing protein n=1 Tax=Paenibacillus sp. J2TS4 TaxID=2807194 RepID=UPI001B0FF3D3|nr:helix-turn-helix domain-containing protein [Paenibacillus sp. J2TS4]GIP33139.1 XRE family transcriptional regulator [Paenibacillus sp. J2TS4]
MHELGQLLKKQRIEKGISLDDLQETTKIRKRYLEAIEEGNYKVLPGNFYVRAFIKTYAEAVGLDPNELLQLYRNVLPATDPDTAVEQVTRSRVATKTGDGWGKWVTGIMLWAFLILILFLIWFFVNKYHVAGSDLEEPGRHKITDRQSSEINNPNATSTPSAGTVQPTATPSPTPTPQPAVELVKSENGVDFYQINGTDKINVELTVTGKKCWVGLDSLPDKVSVDQGNFENGASKSWELTEPVFMTLGAPNAVELKVNGVSINVGDKPNPKRFQFEFAQSDTDTADEL